MRSKLGLLYLMIVSISTMTDAFAKPSRLEPKPDEVGIYYSGVTIPLNRIILIRKAQHYCALKFTNAWIEMDEERLKQLSGAIEQGGATARSAKESAEKKFATYESYYGKGSAQGFVEGNIQRGRGTASLLPLRGHFRPFVYQPGNGCVECGDFKLLWAYKTCVTFIPLGKSSDERDYGFELAPTPWTRIEEVNVNDLRIRWYRYDGKRETTFLPVEELWETER